MEQGQIIYPKKFLVLFNVNFWYQQFHFLKTLNFLGVYLLFKKKILNDDIFKILVKLKMGDLTKREI